MRENWRIKYSHKNWLDSVSLYSSNSWGLSEAEVTHTDTQDAGWTTYILGHN